MDEQVRNDAERRLEDRLAELVRLVRAEDAAIVALQAARRAGDHEGTRKAMADLHVAANRTIAYLLGRPELDIMAAIDAIDAEPER